MSDRTKPLSVVSALLGAAGNCFCEFPNVRENSNVGVQFMELHGVEYIGLGAVASELTAEQRVRDTVAQLTEQTKRLIGVGYLVDTKITNTIPLEVWEREYPEDRTMSRQIRKIINHIKVGTTWMLQQNKSPVAKYAFLLSHKSLRKKSLQQR